MNRIKKVSLAFALLLLAQCPALAATPSLADIQQQVWQRYLSPAEQATLSASAKRHADEAAKEKDAPQGEANQPQSEADQAKAIADMREGFAQFAAKLAPPLVSVPSTPFAEGDIKGLWFKPKQAAQDKVLLYFHGGGYVFGSSTTTAAITGYLAKKANITCFSLDYPLAPENPFPAAPDNALAAYKMLLAKGYKPGNIVFAGDSAGGGLALATLLLIRDKALPMPAGAFLLSPWTDLPATLPSHQDKAGVDITLTKDILALLGAMYAGKHDLKNPLISPVLADLRGLPPLLIHVGSHEILLDDSVHLARNAAMADVPVTIKVWPGYAHVFQLAQRKFEGGRKSLQEGAAFFNDVIGGTLLRPASSK